MLPERLAFALACFATIALVYLGALGNWNIETTMVAVLFGVLASMIIGRTIGMISGRELAKALVDEEERKNGLPDDSASS